MAQISIVRKSQLEGAMRLDAEYYQPKYLQAYDLVKNYQPLREYQKKILHPKEIKRIYADDDSRIIFLLAQNIKRGYLDFSTIAYISPETAAEILQNRLEHGDVVLTRTGANYGDTACYLGVPSPVYASAHCLVIRPKEVSGPLLSVYLNTQIGQMLIKRGVYGSSQPEIAPDYLKTIPIPRFGSEQERSIEELVRSRLVLDQKSDALYLQAGQLLLDELGFKDLDLSHQLYYTVPFKKTKEADRLDAEHFQPKYERLIQHIQRFPYLRLKDVTQTIQNGKTPAAEDYSMEGVPILKVGGLRNTGVIEECFAYVPVSWAQANTKGAVKQFDALVLCAAHLPSYIGKTGLLMEDLGPLARAVGELIILRFNNKVCPEFVCVYLNLGPVRLAVQRLTRGNTAHLYPDDLSTLPIPLLPSEFQQRIADLVTQSWEARQKASQLMEEAKSKVENLIEDKA